MQPAELYQNGLDRFFHQHLHGAGVLAERDRDELYKLASVTSLSPDGPSSSGKHSTMLPRWSMVPCMPSMPGCANAICLHVCDIVKGAS